MKKPKQSTINKNKLKLWSLYLKKIMGKDCNVCGAEKIINVHHILPKERYPEFKYEFLNGIVLCVKCHKFGKYSAHKNGMWFAKWLKQNRPLRYKWAMENL